VLAVQVTMAEVFSFGSESTTEGHPDKLCDQVSDAVLDACLSEDPKCKVACESASKDNMVMVFGEITTSAKLNYDQIVRKAVKGIGYDSYEDKLDTVDSKGVSDKTCEVLVRINKQSPDIAGGVHVGKDEMDVGAGDQGIMFGYASDETEVCMPLTILIATRLGKKLTDVRKDGSLWWLRPDGKTQVTIEYKQNDDGSVEPLKIHTVVISTQHAEPSKAKRSKECEGYKGPEMTAPTMEMMNEAIEKDAIDEVCSKQTKVPAKLCQAALTKVWNSLATKECSPSSTKAPCCQNHCADPSQAKYYSIAKSMHGVPHCGEACMDPKNFKLFHVFEPNLTKAENDSPCKEFGYTEYDSTATHGAGPISMTLDLYDLPKFSIVV